MSVIIIFTTHKMRLLAYTFIHLLNVRLATRAVCGDSDDCLIAILNVDSKNELLV